MFSRITELSRLFHNVQLLLEEAGGMQFNTSALLPSKHFPVCWESFRVPFSLTTPDPSWHDGFDQNVFFFFFFP